MDARSLLAKNDIVPDVLKDQFFLQDDSVMDRMITWGRVNSQDIVLEIGAGNGVLTRKLAAKAKKVIAFEIDPRLQPLLQDLPDNVELHMQDARDFVLLRGKLSKQKPYNKIVANLPYSFVEMFLHNLTFLDYDKAILLIPQKLIQKIETNPVFGSFFAAEQKCVVKKSQFYPVPKTDSAVIDLHRLPDPTASHNLSLFLQQYIYQHEDQKAGNSLREGLIKFSKKAKNQPLPKNQARAILESKHIPPHLLDKTPHNREIYSIVSQVFASDQIVDEV